MEWLDAGYFRFRGIVLEQNLKGPGVANGLVANLCSVRRPDGDEGFLEGTPENLIIKLPIFGL